MSLASYMGQTGQQYTNQVGGQTQAQQNLYNPQQQALQGGLGGFYNSMLSGNIPSSFTNPAAAIQAYNTNFQSSVAPGLAAQYGAGSPVIGSQNAEGLANLQGSLYNTGVTNYLNTLGGAGNYAFNTTGQTGNTATSQAQGTDTSQQSTINPIMLAILQAASGGTFASDRRLKKDIEEVEDGLKKIEKLHPVHFNWKELAYPEPQIGFIAQEVDEVIPEAVKIVGDIYTLEPAKIIPVLVKAVQELSQRVKELEHDKHLQAVG